MNGWFPVADEYDVISRHVARTSLHGHELVVWRADDGNVNVWENRCLHRGVRLSAGVNDGAELVCRYHAWRYANRSGGCTYIPAHPADSPPRTATCATFPVVEHYGLIWTTLEGDTAAPAPPEVASLDADPFVLRARSVRAPVAAVLDRLAELSFAPSGSGCDVGSCTIDRRSSSDEVTSTSSDGSLEESVVYFVVPDGDERCVVRPVRSGHPSDPSGVWRHHAAILARLVEQTEQAAPTPSQREETPVALPTIAPRRERLTVRIDRKWETAAGIAAFELVDARGETLPAFQPGDHIDVHLPGGLVRQYSLTNGPGETDRFRIGVKRAPDSTGGSVYLHDTAAVGDVIEISPPRNRFPLRRNRPMTVLIAGGIGITPILAMAQALHRVALDFVLHYFAGSEEELAFGEVLEHLGPAVHRHVGLGPVETSRVLEAVLARPDEQAHIAACGPPPMLDRLRTIASEAGWPEDAVAFEYFEVGSTDLSSSFTVELARSARTVIVSAGSTVLDALRADGVALASSCERGACGTCAVGVVEGEIVHHDVFLSSSERAEGDTMLTCVSRAASERLVLDL